MQTDSFITSVISISRLINDIKQFKADFDFSDLDQYHEV